MNVLGMEDDMQSVLQTDTEAETQNINVLIFASSWSLWKRLPHYEGRGYEHCLSVRCSTLQLPPQDPPSLSSGINWTESGNLLSKWRCLPMSWSLKLLW